MWLCVCSEERERESEEWNKWLRLRSRKSGSSSVLILNAVFEEEEEGETLGWWRRRGVAGGGESGGGGIGGKLVGWLIDIIWYYLESSLGPGPGVVVK